MDWVEGDETARWIGFGERMGWMELRWPRMNVQFEASPGAGAGVFRTDTGGSEE